MYFYEFWNRGYAGWEAVTLFIIGTKNCIIHHWIGNSTSFKIIYTFFYSTINLKYRKRQTKACKHIYFEQYIIFQQWLENVNKKLFYVVLRYSFEYILDFRSIFAWETSKHPSFFLTFYRPTYLNFTLFNYLKRVKFKSTIYQPRPHSFTFLNISGLCIPF